MIRFLFGRPGSGKTHTTVEAIRRLVTEEDRRVFLIVPEQQAYSTERELLSALPPEAGRRFSVYSFTRLCDKLAELYGGRAQHTVTRAMKSLLMWENLRQLKGILETYSSSSATDPSLCRKMLSAVEELSVNGISSASLEHAADKLDKGAPLRGKLRDIALVAASYSGLLTEVYGEDPSDRLLRAADQLAKHDFFADSYVFLDSFTSFTVQEYALLREILRQAREVTVTFGCGGRYDSQPQFDSMKDAVRRLTRLCEDLGLETEDVTLTGSHRTVAPELRLLESSLWSFDVTPETRPEIPAEERGSVRAVVCPTVYDEAQAIALHILEAREQGIPYGEIAVAVRDTAAWEGVLDAALEQYSIPYFLSERVDLNRKPAARLLLTALRCVARGWQIEDILTLCKTGLLPLTLREIDYFAEYTDTWRLTGRRMTEDGWSMNPDGYRIGMTGRGREILFAANKVRETVMIPLLSLETKLKGAADIVEQCRALYEYLCELNLKERLMESAETHLAMGQTREAGEQVRLWSFLTETLATVATVMKDAEPLSPDELCTALSLVFADTDIGSVPARHDCVTVGDVSTLRVDHIRVLLAAGLCEGEFPRAISDDGLLSEQDKEALFGLGIELTARAERLTSDELLFVWRAFTKPSDRLILSYASSTTDGQAKSPSSAVTRVGYLLPYLKPTPFRSEYVADGQAPRYRTPVADQVSKPTIRRLLGEEIWLSQSRLQTYSRCPYSYYGAHVLALREQSEAKFDNLNAGNFIHHVMEKYLSRALDEDNRLRPMEEDEVAVLADEIICAYIQELCGDVSRNGRLLRLFDRLRQVSLMLIHSIQEELSDSSFRVAGVEWDTHGRREGDPQPMCMTLPTEHDSDSAVKLLMGGRIDRVDVYRAEDGETVYVRVVDYKSSYHDFTVKSVTEDMNIQLLLYLFTLCSPQNRALFADKEERIPTRVLPASMVYVSPKESTKEGSLLPCRSGVVLNDPEILRAVENHPDTETTFLPSVSRNKKGELTGKGLYSSAQMADLEGILRSAILDTATSMYDGCAHRTPSEDACKYCRVRDCCGVFTGK